MRALAALTLLLLGVPAAASEETPFEPAREAFADAAACKGHLAGLVLAARGQSYEAVEGPYDIAAGDTRIHMVAVEGNGHRISEHRCMAEKLSARSWVHSMMAEEEAFTVESVARSAEWLKPGKAKQR